MSNDDKMRELSAGLRSGALEDPIIHQASGILLARRGTTIDEAVDSLYAAAEVRRVSVAEVAADVVDSTRNDPTSSDATTPESRG